MTETSDSEEVYTRQRRIAQLARQMPGKALTSLNQHLDLAWLREAYRRTRKDGAAGVDGQTAADYEKNLEGNLRSLLERVQSSHSGKKRRIIAILSAEGLLDTGLVMTEISRNARGASDF